MICFRDAADGIYFDLRISMQWIFDEARTVVTALICKKPWKLWFLCDFGKIWPHSCRYGELTVLHPLLSANHHDRTCRPPRIIGA
ncbi:hypothetical protein TIFTF001_044860 [Ficus carica]|uniref:Uncharacterized protein n=1 Tax=Ficus carica TaxID=3494 RepID=A0AA87ZBQ0_FICCA|nr:hypothetical protein TIFTF001_044860 [Ficus carica]